MKMFCRLKPYDPSKMQLRIDYTAPWGKKYIQNEWHEFDMDEEGSEEAIAYLRTIRETMDPASPKAFDICDAKEAKNLIDKEERDRLGITAEEARKNEGPVAPTKVGGTKKAVDLNAPPKVHELQRRAEMELAAEAAAKAEAIEKAKAVAPPEPVEPETPKATPKARPVARRKAPTRSSK